MDDNAIHQWLIECFGPVQGEAAWQQFSQLPESLRDQIRAQGEQGLPKPAEVQSLIQAFTAGGLNTAGDVQRTVEAGPINIRLAKSIASKRISEEGAQSSVDAQEGAKVRSTLSESGLWLDSVCKFNPAPGETQLLTREGWLDGTIEAWAQFAAPVASSMNEALASVFKERLGGSLDGEVSGMFAGPVPIPIPDDLKDPGTLMKLLGNTSFSMQLGQAAGNLSSEVLGSFDQGIALLKSPAGALIPQNIKAYAGFPGNRPVGGHGIRRPARAGPCQALRFGSLADASFRSAHREICARHLHRPRCHGGTAARGQPNESRIHRRCGKPVECGS